MCDVWPRVLLFTIIFSLEHFVTSMIGWSIVAIVVINTCSFSSFNFSANANKVQQYEWDCVHRHGY